MKAAIHEILGTECNRSPNLGAFGWKVEPGRHHPYDRVDRAIKQYSLSHNIGCCAESRLPKCGANHRYFRRVRLVIFRDEWTSEERRHTEDSEEIMRHLPALKTLRLTDACKVIASRSGGTHPLKDAVLRFPFGVIARCRRVFRETETCGVFPQHHDLRRVGIRQRVQKYGASHRKNCGIRPNRDRQK